MALSPHLQEAVERAKQRANTYTPSRAVAESLEDKVLSIIIAPAAMGKSHVMNTAAIIDDEMSRVPVFTTREPRIDDEPDLFRYLPHDDQHVSLLLERFDQGGVVQYAVHPTESTLYGTEAVDYASKFNLLPVLAEVAPTFRALPFERVMVVGLVATPQDWIEWFNHRFPPGHPKRAGRLQEAIGSLVWLLKQPRGTISWLHNERDNAGDAAMTLINITRRGSYPDPHARHLATLCLEAAKRL